MAGTVELKWEWAVNSWRGWVGVCRDEDVLWRPCAVDEESEEVEGSENAEPPGG